MKFKNPGAPAVKREAKEEWSRSGGGSNKIPRLRQGISDGLVDYSFLAVFVSAAATLLFVAIRLVALVWVLILLAGMLSTTALLATLSTTFMATLLLAGITLILSLILPLARASLILLLAWVALVLCHFPNPSHLLSPTGKPLRWVVRSGKSTRYF